MFFNQIIIISTSVRTFSLGFCFDRRGDCKELSDRGECFINPRSMLRDCPVTCGVRCGKYIQGPVCLPYIRVVCQTKPTLLDVFFQSVTQAYSVYLAYSFKFLC